MVRGVGASNVLHLLRAQVGSRGLQRPGDPSGKPRQGAPWEQVLLTPPKDPQGLSPVSQASPLSSAPSGGRSLSAPLFKAN